MIRKQLSLCVFGVRQQKRIILRIFWRIFVLSMRSGAIFLNLWLRIRLKRLLAWKEPVQGFAISISTIETCHYISRIISASFTLNWSCWVQYMYLSYNNITRYDLVFENRDENTLNAICYWIWSRIAFNISSRMLSVRDFIEKCLGAEICVVFSHMIFHSIMKFLP